MKYPIHAVFETRKPWNARMASKLEARYGTVSVEIYVRGVANPRTRRMILLATFRKLCGVLRFVPVARMPSIETKGWNPIIAEHRYASLRQAVGVQTPDQKYGFQVRFLRLQAGLSQQELSTRMGVSRTYVSEIEHGRRHAGLAFQRKFLRMVEVSAKIVPAKVDK